MIPGAMPPQQGFAAVEAHLGRPPQDAIEATIVLEAWTGVRPSVALDLGPGVASCATRTTLSSVPARKRTTGLHADTLMQGAALLLMLLAVSVWAGPLAAWIGSRQFELAWKTALPLILALQWIAQSRFSQGERLGQLRRGFALLTTVMVSLLAVVVVAPSGMAVVAAGLALPWLGMIVLIERRGWAAWHCAFVVVVSAAVVVGVDPRMTLTGLAIGTIAMVLTATWRTPASHRRACPLGTSLLAGLVGAGIGGLLVLGGSVRGWRDGGAVAFLMLPSVVGGLWAASHLRRLWEAIPQSLRAVGVTSASRVRRSPTAAVFVGAMGRYLLVTLALTVALLALAPAHEPGWNELAGGYGAVGLAGLLAALAWSYGRYLFTVFAVAGGLLVVVALQRILPDLHLGLAAGAATVCVILAAPVLAALLAVERSFATRLQIR